MNVYTLEREQRLPLARDEVFAFFSDARNLEAITPPLLRFKVLQSGPLQMRAGTLIRYRLRVHGLPLRWTTVIRVWDPPQRFVDEQLKGPYALWHHTHTFEPDGPAGGGTIMRDVVRYAVGFGPLGLLAERAFVHRDVASIFDYRARRIAELM